MDNIQVYWLEQCEADMPANNDWLGPDEIVRLNGFHIGKRRADWRLGRWTAKRAIASYLGWPADLTDLASIEVHPAWSGAPEASIPHASVAPTISISHRSGTALCAVSIAGVDLGCDLETIEPRDEAFVRDYFTAEEQQVIEKAPLVERNRTVALLWSAKESVLKALHEGLRLDPRSVFVTYGDDPPDAGEWTQLTGRCGDYPIFQGWWSQTGQILRTMVVHPPSRSPARLQT